MPCGHCMCATKIQRIRTISRHRQESTGLTHGKDPLNEDETEQKPAKDSQTVPKSKMQVRGPNAGPELM